MTRGDSIESRFTEDIERLLRGEQPVSVADGDYRATLDFAGQLMSLRQEPDPGFADRLRQDLMLRFAEQDVATSRSAQPSLLERLFGSHALRLAVVSTFVVLAAVGLVWRAGYLSPMMEQAGDALTSTLDEGGAEPSAEMEEPAPEMARVGEDDVEEEAASVALPSALPVSVAGHVAAANTWGQDIEISILFENEGPDGVMLSPFPPAVFVRETGTDRVVYGFDAGLSQLALSSMESTSYDIVWDQNDWSGTPVEPGRYEVDVDWTVAQPEKGAAAYAVNARGIAAFEILPDSSVTNTEE